MNITISNNGNRFTFTDLWCNSAITAMISYDISKPIFFTLSDISFHQEKSIVKKSVEKKKLFKTVLIEIEETVLDNYIMLSYKPHANKDEIKTIKIDVEEKEIPLAKQIIDYLTPILKAKTEIDTKRKQEEQLRLNELLKTEQDRLSKCIYDLVVIDFETTGIKSPLDGEKYDEILSVSIIDQDGNILLNSLCSPQRRKTWATAQEIHGISPAMVKGKPTFEELFPSIKEILYKAKLVIAYNIDFEMRFLWGFDLEFGKPGGTQLIRNVVWGPDPMLMYSAYKGVEKWQKLSSAAKHFKFPFEAHDSLEDVKATLHCYKKMLEYVQKNPDKNYIVKYGYLYDSGKKGKWLDLISYKLLANVPVDYSDVYKN